MSDAPKPRSLVLDPGLDKLQARLLEMSPGELLSIEQAAKASGLSRDICVHVLDTLTRAGLMTRTEPETYLRVQAGLPEEPS